MPLRVLFFGNSDSVFSNRHFDALLKTRCKVVGVVDVPPAKRISTNTAAGSCPSFVVTAKQCGIPTFEPASPNTPEFVNATRELDADLFVAVGYMNLLKPEILSLPRLLAANFHASLLPAYRGKHPVFWALRNGDKWAGLTVHVMDAGLDTGDILYRVRVRSRVDDTVGSLYDRIMERSVPLVERLIADAEAGTLVRQPQTSHGASYYSSAHEQDFLLNWSRDAAHLCRWIRTSPGQCFTDVSGHRVFFEDAAPRRIPTTTPGCLAEIGRTGVTIATGEDGIGLRVRRVRVDNGEPGPAASIFRDLQLNQGDSLKPSAVAFPLD